MKANAKANADHSENSRRSACGCSVELIGDDMCCSHDSAR
jgi:hypothetical protein